MGGLEVAGKVDGGIPSFGTTRMDFNLGFIFPHERTSGLPRL
jgi:hypothetical protein